MSFPNVLPVAVSTSTSLMYASIKLPAVSRGLNTSISTSSVRSIVGDDILCPYFSANLASSLPVRIAFSLSKSVPNT